MAARSEVSKKNKYWIDRHRHYELKHFCLQYPNWKKFYEDAIYISATSTDVPAKTNEPSDPTSKQGIRRTYYSERIELVEKVAREADENLHCYILKAVTEDLSYTYLKAVMDVPCGRDMYYDRYRRFFWLLDKARD